MRRGLFETFRALRNRNYRLFWCGQVVSQSGTWMQRVGQAWLVLQMTDSPQALGIVSALQFLPILTLSLFGGVFADRFPKQRVLVTTQSIMAVQAVLLAALTTSGHIQLWHIYALAMLLGTANALDNPSRQSFVSEMVGKEDLPNAVLLNSTLFNTARVAGPAIGGAIVALFGVVACFWLNAASFIATITALLAMRASELHDVQPANRAPVLDQLREGIGYALRTRDVCVLVIGIAFVGCFGYNFQVVIPLLGHYVLDSGPLGFGVLFSCQGLGSIVSALLMASRSAPSERTWFIGGAIFATLLLLIALSRQLWLTAGLIALAGGASVVFSSTANTRLQLKAPGHLRGRVMGLYSFLMLGSTPIGAYTLGTLSERLNVPTALATCSVLCMFGLGASLLYASRQPRQPGESFRSPLATK